MEANLVRSDFPGYHVRVSSEPAGRTEPRHQLSSGTFRPRWRGVRIRRVQVWFGAFPDQCASMSRWLLWVGSGHALPRMMGPLAALRGNQRSVPERPVRV